MQKYAWIFHALGKLFGTDVCGQIAEHIFAPNRAYCVYYPSNLFHNAHSFENWGIFLDVPQFYLGNNRSLDIFGPIGCERKYWMDHNSDNKTPPPGNELSSSLK